MRRHPKGSTHNSRTMEHHRRLGIGPRDPRSLPADQPADRRQLLLHASPAGSLAASRCRRRPTSAAPSPPRPPPTRCPSRSCAPTRCTSRRSCSSTRARGPTSPSASAGRSTGFQRGRRRRHGRGGVRRRPRKAGARNISSAATAGEASCAARWRCATAASPRSTRRTTAAAERHLLPRADALPRSSRAPAGLELLGGAIRRARCTIISLNDDEEFLAFSKAPDDGTPPSDEAAIATIVRAVGAELPIKIIGHWPWTAGVALVADRFVADRVVLAGDAVHLFTPTGGFGMNTGMDDASNLSWKLAALVQGWGGAGLHRLLRDRAQADRAPQHHRRPRAEQAARQHAGRHRGRRQYARRRRNAPQGQRASRRDDRGIRLARRAAWRALRRLADRRPRTARRRPTTTSTTSPSGVPGGRAPHYWPAPGRGVGDSLFDRFGKGFTLLRLGGKAPDTGSIEAAAHAARRSAQGDRPAAAPTRAISTAATWR